MDFKRKSMKIIIPLTIFVYFSLGNLFPQDVSKYTEKSMYGLKKHIDTQKMYEAMPESIPAACLLAVDGLGGVEADFLEESGIELKKQMVLTSTFRPVLMTKWLDGEFSADKSSSIFQLLSILRKKRYPVSLRTMLKPKVLRCGGKYIILLNLYGLNNDRYPIKALRIMDSKKELPEAMENCLLDLRRLYDEKKGGGRKRLAVMPFEITCRTLAEQKNGDFDFIKTSFSVQEGVELKDSDDYFSELFAYQAECTGLFNSLAMTNIREYSRQPSSVGSVNADYIVKGKIQLTDRINLIEIKLVNCESGKIAGTYRYFTQKADIETLWKINNRFIKEICGVVFSADKYVPVEKIECQGRAFYAGGMFAGRNVLEDYSVAKENLKIKTGSFMKADSDDGKSLYIYIEKNRMETFKGREGEFVWNLLEK